MGIDKNLLALIHVVEMGNLTAAADKIGLAQPSLTKRLKSLEYEYGAPLFQRLPHGMEPTDIGSTLYDHAKRIQRQYLQAMEAVKAKKIGEIDTIRIGAGPFFRSYYMRPLFEELRKKFPYLKLEFRVDVHMRNLPVLMNGELDVVFGALADDPSNDELHTFPVSSLDLGALVHASHPLAGKRPQHYSVLLDYPWVIYSEDPLTEQMVNSFFVRQGLRSPKFEVVTTSFEFCLDLVANGKFITPAACQLANTYANRGVKLIDIQPSIDRFPIGGYIRRSSLDLVVFQEMIRIVEKFA